MTCNLTKENVTRNHFPIWLNLLDKAMIIGQAVKLLKNFLFLEPWFGLAASLIPLSSDFFLLSPFVKRLARESDYFSKLDYGHSAISIVKSFKHWFCVLPVSKRASQHC